MIVDIHTHVFPDAVADKALTKMRGNSHVRTFVDGTRGQLAASAREAGIDRSVVLPVATSARQVAHINDFALKICEEQEESGVQSFGAAHPEDPDWEKELKRIAAAGIRGIKIHPPYQGMDIDAPAYLRILDKAGELGLIVVTHAGYDVGLPGAEESTVRKIASALRQVGPVTVVCAHMGGWRQWEEVRELLAGTRVMLDTSFSLGSMTPLGDGYAWTEETLRLLPPKEFCGMVRLFGAERILFGTDSPWSDRKREVEAIRALPLTDREKSLILGENAARLLSRKSAPV